MKNTIVWITLSLLLLWGAAPPLHATPFPVKADILNGAAQPIGIAHAYPRFVEIYTLENKKIGRVGILVEKGIARIHMVKENEELAIVGYAKRGIIYNHQDKIMGTYFWTPTWSYAHFPNGKRAGSIKCIAWPRVCSVGVAGYLLGLYGKVEGQTNQKLEMENENP